MIELEGTSQIKYMTSFKQVSELTKLSGAISCLKLTVLSALLHQGLYCRSKASTMDLSLSSNCLYKS